MADYASLIRPTGSFAAPRLDRLRYLRPTLSSMLMWHLRIVPREFSVTVQCPQISEVAIIADDAHLAAQLSCVLAARRKYLPILEQPRLTRPDRDGEVIRCTNALARSKAKHFIFAGLGDITSTALSVGVPA